MSVQGDRRLGGFRILEPLKDGTGSQGSVFKAVCEREAVPGVSCGEIVALKTMVVRDEDGALYSKFARRTAELQSIDHPNVIRYKGCFAESGPFSSMHVAVMELLEGETLKERLKVNTGGLDADEAIRITDAALAGLEAAAAIGLVHRDIKPGNIFLCKDGSVKLIDFEIARKEGGSVSTASGKFAGTFDYMAPEFADPNFRGDFRSDVFSMGVVMHEALTGDVPYARAKEKGEHADFAFLSRWSQRQEGLCAIRIRSSVKRLLSRADGVLSKALAENPSERYATPSEFRVGIKTILFRELRSEIHAYRLLRIVGRGGFGEVFKARIRGTGEFVAIKHLLKASYGDRFRREARIMRQLDDPAFVRFVDYFETQHAGNVESFLVMSFLPGMPGMSLRDAIKRHRDGHLPVRDVLEAFALYARALGMMHGRGIYHRDIKPSNLYYPEGAPSKSAIMDLGIARDVNGTATVGQVPGTLDYMPPEVVVGGSRGDAGMDIYALGLCLYEALAGKMAYPRLPTGPTAFAAFFARAKSRVAPVFDSPVVASNPVLKSLLVDMTAIDPSMRLSDADVLHRRLVDLLSDTMNPRSAVPARQAVVAPSRRSAPVGSPPRSSVHEILPPRTVATSSVASAERIPERLPEPSGGRGFPVRLFWVMAVAAAIGAGAMLGWPALNGWIEEYRRKSAERRQHEIELERQKAEADAAAAEMARAESVRQVAISEADNVVSAFESQSVSALAAYNRSGEWQLRWRGNADVESVFAQQTNRFAKAYAQRQARDSGEALARKVADARRAAKTVVEECGLKDVSLEDCSVHARAWSETWRGELDSKTYREISVDIAEALRNRKNRDKQDADNRLLEAEQAERRLNDERVACEQAKSIVDRYSDEATAPELAKADFAGWQNKWARYQKEPFYVECQSNIAEAEKERSLLESGRAVAAECDRWLANIPNVNERNVKNWRDNLDRASLELKMALGGGRISEKAAEPIRRRIDECRGWAVGVIDNKTHRTVEFGGSVIGPVSVGTVVFTNGVPQGVAVTSEGCEPFRVREDAFDGRTTIVMPKDMVERRGGIKVRVPDPGPGVTCLLDGVLCAPGIVELRQGRHHMVYRNGQETYPGVPDFKEQSFSFDAYGNAVVDVPPPDGNWSRSPEFAAAKCNADLLERGRSLMESCLKLMDPEPLDTRRQRLESAHAILSDWKTSSALAVLGEGVERDLVAAYDAERRRVRGYVKNETSLSAMVRTDVSDAVIPPGSKEVVTFERAWPSDAHVSVPGYEFVLLPRLAEDFDGTTFVVSEQRLVPSPVKAYVPPVDEDVTCLVGGKVVERFVMLRPGTYECVYRKPDCVAQKMEFTVSLGESLMLPAPGKWVPSDSMSMLSEAMGRFTSGAVGEAKAIASRIGTIEDPARRRELEDLKKAIELREKLEQQ